MAEFEAITKTVTEVGGAYQWGQGVRFGGTVGTVIGAGMGGAGHTDNTAGSPEIAGHSPYIPLHGVSEAVINHLWTLNANMGFHYNQMGEVQAANIMNEFYRDIGRYTALLGGKSAQVLLQTTFPQEQLRRYTDNQQPTNTPPVIPNAGILTDPLLIDRIMSLNDVLRTIGMGGYILNRQQITLQMANYIIQALQTVYDDKDAEDLDKNIIKYALKDSTLDGLLAQINNQEPIPPTPKEPDESKHDTADNNNNFDAVDVIRNRQNVNLADYREARDDFQRYEDLMLQDMDNEVLIEMQEIGDGLRNRLANIRAEAVQNADELRRLADVGNHTDIEMAQIRYVENDLIDINDIDTIIEANDELDDELYDVVIGAERDGNGFIRNSPHLDTFRENVKRIYKDKLKPALAVVGAIGATAGGVAGIMNAVKPGDNPKMPLPQNPTKPPTNNPNGPPPANNPPIVLNPVAPVPIGGNPTPSIATSSLPLDVTLKSVATRENDDMGYLPTVPLNPQVETIANVNNDMLDPDEEIIVLEDFILTHDDDYFNRYNLLNMMSLEQEKMKLTSNRTALYLPFEDATDNTIHAPKPIFDSPPDSVFKYRVNGRLNIPTYEADVWDSNLTSTATSIKQKDITKLYNDIDKTLNSVATIEDNIKEGVSIDPSQNIINKSTDIHSGEIKGIFSSDKTVQGFTKTMKNSNYKLSNNYNNIYSQLRTPQQKIKQKIF